MQSRAEQSIMPLSGSAMLLCYAMLCHAMPCYARYARDDRSPAKGTAPQVDRQESAESSGWYEREVSRARGARASCCAEDAGPTGCRTSAEPPGELGRQASADAWWARDAASPKSGGESKWGTAAGAAKELALLRAFSSNADQCASGPNLWRWAAATYYSAVGGRESAKAIAKADLKPQEKSVRVARECAYKQRCLRRRHYRGAETLELMPIFAKAFASEYGVPVAIIVRRCDTNRCMAAPLRRSAASRTRVASLRRSSQVYLRFLLLCAAVFVAMFLLELPAMLDNSGRNELRNACRGELGDSLAGYASLVAVDCAASSASQANATASELCARCGLSGLSPRVSPIPLLPSYMLLATGACMEYVEAEQDVLLIPPKLSGSLGDYFEETPRADFCLKDKFELRSYLAILNVAIFTIFLLLVKRDAREIAHTDRRKTWKASDYAVMIVGLEQGVPADDQEGELGLESRLYEDLASIGFRRDEIDHIEVGRVCMRMQRLQRRLAELCTEEHEIDAMRKLHADSRKLYEAHGEVWKQLARTQQQLEEFRVEGQRSTGHAFVVFQLEARRNDLVRAFSRPSWLERRLEWLLGRVRVPPPKLTTSASRPALELGDFLPAARKDKSRRASAKRDGSLRVGSVTVGAAPEPHAIFWEHLELSRAQLLRRKAKTWAVAVALIALGVIATVSTKAWQADYDYKLKTRDDFDQGSSMWQLRAYVGTIASALVISGVDLALICIMPVLTRSEQHPTWDEYQRSVFSKLAISYTFNACVIPVAISLLPVGVSQAWYEGGGVVTQGVYLIIAAGVGFQVYQLVQPETLFFRYVLAKTKQFAASQRKLNELWEPPGILFGGLYAGTFKVVTLCLVYAPFWPPAYLLTAVRHARSEPTCLADCELASRCRACWSSAGRAPSTRCATGTSSRRRSTRC